MLARRLTFILPKAGEAAAPHGRKTAPSVFALAPDEPLTTSITRWITITWSAVAPACLTLAAVHWLIRCKQTDQRAHLLFALAAACELRMMRAQTPEQFAAALGWAHLPVFCLAASMVGFVRLYFRAGRP